MRSWPSISIVRSKSKYEADVSCYPSCLWSQTQLYTSYRNNSQSLGYQWTIRHRCIFMWSWTEMLTLYYRQRARTTNSASYEYRNMSARRGAQIVPIGIPTICCETHENVVDLKSVYLLFESECSFTKLIPSRTKTKYMYLRFLFLWMEFRMIVAGLLLSFWISI